ncbi:hypothetical protein ACIBG8_08215 [Nonomuraea sp. NPDC050556]|uniref:hypothetical protein n=1 Tax=Nonomuraea sp. NPDC050556 TaxID=3364369 RepID=UPI0037BD3FE7
MRKRLFAMLIAAATAVVASVSPAAADVAPPPGCSRGFFCVSPTYNTNAIWGTDTGWGPYPRGQGIVGRYWFNNGSPDPGQDHVDVTYYTQSGAKYVKCVHYYPGPGQYSVSFSDAVEVVQVRWRGEC